MKTKLIYLRTKVYVERHFVICFLPFLQERELFERDHFVRVTIKKRKLDYTRQFIILEIRYWRRNSW